MLLVGLTGGIGSGKSTVAAMLAQHGAVIVDADVLAREVIEPGTPGFDRVVARFGTEVVTDDGALDRAALAAEVFADERARLDLEAIVHPEVFRRLAETAADHRDTDDVVVFDAPLIVEAGHASAFDVMVLVSAPVEERVRRVLASRPEMTEEQVRERIAAQLSDEDKAKVSHHVIDNTGTLDDLQAAVDALWPELEALSSA
jgi:dephospho-CoA kinase